MIDALADKFSKSTERLGMVTVQGKQVWNWFQTKRYALRAKLVKSPGKLTVLPKCQDEVVPVRNMPPGPQPVLVPSGRNAPENSHVEFEAKSARDGSLYDVQAFASHRYLNTSDPEIVPLRKVCRRLETDYRFHHLHILNESAPSSDLPKASSDPISGSSLVTSDSKDAAVMHPNATENPDVGTIMAAAAASNMSVGPGMVASKQKKFECSPPGLAGAVGGVPVGGAATTSFQ